MHWRFVALCVALGCAGCQTSPQKTTIDPFLRPATVPAPPTGAAIPANGADPYYGSSAAARTSGGYMPPSSTTPTITQPPPPSYYNQSSTAPHTGGWQSSALSTAQNNANTGMQNAMTVANTRVNDGVTLANQSLNDATSSASNVIRAGYDQAQGYVNQANGYVDQAKQATQISIPQSVTIAPQANTWQPNVTVNSSTVDITQLPAAMRTSSQTSSVSTNVTTRRPVLDDTAMVETRGDEQPSQGAASTQLRWRTSGESAN